MEAGVNSDIIIDQPKDNSPAAKKNGRIQVNSTKEDALVKSV
jgi:hypothetical protein